MNESDINSVSLSLLDWTTVSSVYWVLIGIISVLNNSFLLAIVGLHKRPKTNFHVNILHLAGADLIVGLVQTCIGLKRLYLTITNQPETSTPNKCSWEQGPLTFAMQVSVTQTFCLASDRFNAVLFPVWYRNHLTSIRIQALNVSLWCWSLIVTLIGIKWGLNTAFLVPICTMSTTYSEMFFQGFLLLLALYSLLIVAEYIIMAIVVKKRANGNATNHTSQSHAADSIRFILGIYLVTWFCTSVFADAMTLFMPVEQSRVIMPYLVGVTGVSSAVNFPIYLWKNQEIRDDFRQMTKCWRKVGTTSSFIVINPT